jgi:pimeloyl-ACP methyl ester carboxylesterase
VFRVSWGSSVALSLLVVLGACSQTVPDRIVEIEPDAIRPFNVQVPDEILDDLDDRLKRARLPDQIPDTDWSYGTDGAYLSELIDYWRTEFDWRAQEQILNELDQFTTVIDGVDLHFIHQRSSNPDAVPLLLIHGWPGSIFEFMEIIGPLSDPASYGGNRSDAFHLVIPSLPGFGFSGKPSESGWSPERMAAAFAELMERLDYDRYGVQGGDWGGIIGRSLAGNYPDRVIGFHTNFVLGGPPPNTDRWAGVSEEERTFLADRTEAFAEGSGYQEIQGTKPQSLGVGLNDSPAGLAAWIVEKFHGWSDHDGHVEDAFTRDQILANVTLYWVTETITSSARIYYESRHAQNRSTTPYVSVPTAGAIFPKEIYFTPRAWAEHRYNIVRWTVMPRGGHFAALEEPHLLVDDVRAFFRELPSQP